MSKPTTLKGLRPGTYAIEASRVRTTKGKSLKPVTPFTWVTVKAGKSATSVVRYRARTPEVQDFIRKIDPMQTACTVLHGTGWRVGHRDVNDPMSLFCTLGNEYRGLDLNAYCRWWLDSDRSYALLRNSRTVYDWWCARP